MTGGLWPNLYPLIMLSALGAALLVKRRQRIGPALPRFAKAWLALTAFTGAMLLAKLPYLIPGLPGFDDAGHVLVGGKTILFGMVGGYLGVELGKKTIRLTSKTGDSFVVPVATSIAIGRLACFAGGCCYGTPSSLSWAVTFPAVDHLPRHPTQIYEFFFHAACALIATWMLQHGRLQGQLIKVYFLAYFCYRFLTESIRPEPRIVAGLTAYQISAGVFAAVFVALYLHDARQFRQRRSIVVGRGGRSERQAIPERKGDASTK